MKLTFFVSTNEKGSYYRLASRQANFLKKQPDNPFSEIKIIPTFQYLDKIENKDGVSIVYTTFNVFTGVKPKLFLDKEKTVFMLDTALYTLPYLDVMRAINEGYRIYAVAHFNYQNLSKFGHVEYMPHFIPPPVLEPLPYNQREYDFITVGINETDFDRKGHFWNYVTQRWGFKSIEVCMNYCFGTYKTDVSDNDLFNLYRKTKWYLATSHAESPHLPLLEAFSYGTPAVFINAHEFYHLNQTTPIGIPINPSFVSIKGKKVFWFYEIDPESFLEAVATAYNTSPDSWNKLSENVRKLFDKEYNMEFRLSQFYEMLGVGK